MSNYIRIIDTTCRDGMHAMAHAFSTDQVAMIAECAETAGIDTIEVSHGDGLGGSSLQYGLGSASDEEWLTAAASKLKNTKLAVLLLPGIGTKNDLEVADNHGMQVARIATHATEADISEQHIGLVKKMGKEAIGLLMMVHMVSAEKLLEQASLMQDYGADGIYLMDSAGALLPEDVKERVSLLVEKLNIPVGFHAHNNLSLAVANTLMAIEYGAAMVDGTMRGLGAGAGNAQLEVLVGIFDKLGYESGVNFYKLLDMVELKVEKMMKRPQVIDNASLILGYSGVYSSFLLHTYRAAKKFNLDPRDILVELGRRKMVGGQEDMIVSVALDLAAEAK
jgi:4-hydroxy-2-oxovalerate aldolase